jgi:hypothetical protein
LKNEMIRGLLNLLTHVASVYHDNMPLPKVVQGKDLAKGCRPHKEGSPWGSLSAPNAFPGKATIFGTSQGVNEGLDLEQTFFGGDPPQLVFAASAHFDWMQHLEERNKNIHLPIVSLPGEAHVQLVGIAQKLQIICNNSVLNMGNTK